MPSDPAAQVCESDPADVLPEMPKRCTSRRGKPTRAPFLELADRCQSAENGGTAPHPYSLWNPRPKEGRSRWHVQSV